MANIPFLNNAYFSSKVGIGTDNPGAKLTVNESSTVTPAVNIVTARYGISLQGAGTSNSQYLLNLQSNGGATDVMRVQSSGNVGIGTTSPSATLHVKSTNFEMLHLQQDDANGGLIRFSNTDDTNGWYAGIAGTEKFIISRDASNSSPIITVEQNGNVGIGTDSPNENLHVHDTATPRILLTDNTTGTTSGSDGMFIGIAGDQGLNIWNYENTYTRFAVNNAERMRIDSSGKVGIGTTSPDEKLRVDGNIKSAGDFIGAALRLGFAGSANITTNDTNEDLLINPNGSGDILMHTTSSGNVGIGTTSPSEKLDVNGNIKLRGTNNLTIGSTSNGGNFSLSSGIRGFNFANNNGDLVRIDSSGNVGIGTTSPDSKLDIEDSNPFVTIQGNSSSYVNAGVQFISNQASTTRGLGNFYYSAHSDVEWFSGLPYGGNDAFVINRNASYTVPSSKSSPPGIGASAGTLLKVNSNGAIQFNTYSGTNKTGTATYLLGTDANGNVVKTNTVPGSGAGPYLPLAGGTMTGDLRLNDSVELELGSDADIRIYHDGSNGYINSFKGDLYIRTFDDDKDIVFQSDDGSGGVATYFYLDGGGVLTRAVKNIRTNDGAKFQAGSSGDLEIFHDGSNSYIENYTGDFIFTQALDDGDMIFKSDNGSGGTTPYFKLDGSLVNGTTTLGAVNFPDKSKIFMGTGSDFRLYHDGSNSYIENETGNLTIFNKQDDGDVIFASDNGSGGTAEYLKLDGGITSLVASKDLLMAIDGDGGKLKFGASQDLHIYHDGANSNIDNYNGNLDIIQRYDDGDIRFYNDNGSGGTTEYFRIDGGATKTTVSKAFQFFDNVKAEFGDSSDLQIYHGGSNSYIKDTGTGSLWIQGSTQVIIGGANGNIGVEYVENLGVGLRYNNVNKLSTTSTGVGITGDADVSSAVLVGNNNSIFAENNIRFKSSGAAYIDHNTVSQSIKFRTSVSSALDTTPLTLTGTNAAIEGKATSAATITSDGSSTLTTKGYVDGLITGATIYRGAWDPSGGGYGSPDLSGVTQTSGYYYICSAAGTAEPNGTGTEPDSWAVGDWVIYNDVSGTGQWQKIDNSSVLSGAGTGQTVALWQGTSSVTDSETLGNAPITVSGNNTTFAGHIIPTTDNTQDLGTTNSLDFRTLYIRNIDIYNQRLFIETSGTLPRFFDHPTVGDGFQFMHLGTEILRLGNGSSTAATFAGTVAWGNSTGLLTYGSDRAIFRAASNKALELQTNGGTTLMSGIGANATFAGDINVTGDILPVNTGASDLGTDSKRFGSLFTNGAFIGALTSNDIQIQGDVKILNKAQTAYIDFAARNATGSEAVMDITNAGNATFAGTVNVDSDLKVRGASGEDHFVIAPQAAGTGTYLISYNNGETGYEPLRIDAESYNFTNAGTSVISTSGLNTTFAGNVTVNSDSFSLNGTAPVMTVNSSNNASGFRINVTGLDGDGDTLFRAQDSGTTRFTIKRNGDSTFTGDVTVGDKTYPKINLTDNQGVTRNFSVGTNNETFTVRNETASSDALTISNANNATFAGSIDTTAVNIKVGTAIHGTITSSSNSLTLNARNTGKLIFQSGGVEKMRINGTNVGIGTTSPDYQLEVENTSAQATLGITGGNTDARLHLKTNNGNWMLQNDYSNNGALSFYNSGHRLVVTKSGDVGIGTTSPSTIFQVDTGDASGNKFGLTGDGSTTGAALWTNWTTGASYLDFRLGGTSSTHTRMRVQHDGKVGIGTTSPSELLELKPGSGGDSKINIVNSSGVQKALIGYDNGNGGLINLYNEAGTRNVVVRGYGNSYFNGGDVGIGTTSPVYKLDVDGGASAGGKVTYTKEAGSLDTTGYAVAGITALPGGNGKSCGFTFTCFGGTGKYQKLVYSCYNSVGTWYAKKVIDEGTNDLDVVASANGSTITFTFKAKSSSQSFTPKVTVEAVGTSINSTYA